MTSQIRTSVPETGTPAGRCEYCGLPFPDDERLVLHRGLEHRPELDTAERNAFVTALSNEDGRLRTLRLKALAAIVLLYFVFLFQYAIFA